jgi:site-specific DNA-methyltransferase (adenine-specific)
MRSEVHLIDCVEFMRGLPDKAFDLAVVDPPYGIGAENHAGNKENGWTQWEKKDWDKNPPNYAYFEQLIRVSKNQIIWGANHFIQNIPDSNSPCWIVWDKGQRDFSLADGELAWTSFDNALRIFTYSRAKALKDGKIHPTQKPVALYDWIFRNYAKPGDTILDTHMGSQSSRISAYKAGLDFTGCELDPEYFEQGNNRFNEFLKKHGTPDPKQAIKGQQINLF